MADNFTSNAGAGGATFASDDVGGVQYPRVKATFGADGTATDISAANPLPVTTTNPAVITAGQVAVTSTATALPSFAYTNGIVITASASNTAPVYVGSSGVTAATGYPLEAGQSIAYGIVNGSAIFLISAAAQAAAYTGN
jgi:hypothetical protein